MFKIAVCFVLCKRHMLNIFLIVCNYIKNTYPFKTKANVVIKHIPHSYREIFRKLALLQKNHLLLRSMIFDYFVFLANYQSHERILSEVKTLWRLLIGVSLTRNLV